MLVLISQRGFDAILDTFGLWAILSGAIQLVVGLRRHTLISAQWLMVISGAGSIVAGITFLRWSGSAHDGLAVLIQYSTGGAIWYVVSALWLRATTFRASTTT